MPARPTENVVPDQPRRERRRSTPESRKADPVRPLGGPPLSDWHGEGSR
jgi:hypothetical protein